LFGYAERFVLVILTCGDYIYQHMSFTTRAQLQRMTAEVDRRDARIKSWPVSAHHSYHSYHSLYAEHLVRGLYPDSYTFVYEQIPKITMEVEHVLDLRTEKAGAYDMRVLDDEGQWIATHRCAVLELEGAPYCLLESEPHMYPPAVPQASGPTLSASAELLAALSLSSL
jgi:hypothetical protein